MRHFIIALLLTSPLAAADTPADDLKAVATLLAGSYSSAEQAKADATFFDVRLEMAPIWADTKEHWLYVEQAMATSLDKPYRQRVYKLEAKDGTVISRVYTLPGDALQYAGAFKDVKKLDGLTPAKLVEREGCAIVLKKEKDSWKGATVGTGCKSDLKGAAYATSEVVLTEKLLTSWDRGYDKDGKQVWGATKGAYQFVKLKK